MKEDIRTEKSVRLYVPEPEVLAKRYNERYKEYVNSFDPQNNKYLFTEETKKLFQKSLTLHIKNWFLGGELS